MFINRLCKLSYKRCCALRSLRIQASINSRPTPCIITCPKATEFFSMASATVIVELLRECAAKGFVPKLYAHHVHTARQVLQVQRDIVLTFHGLHVYDFYKLTD